MADIIADEFARYPAHMRPVKGGDPRDDLSAFRMWTIDMAGEENARRAKLREAWIDPDGQLGRCAGPPPTIQRSPESQAWVDKMIEDQKVFTPVLINPLCAVLQPRVRRLTLTAQDSGYLVNTGASEAGSATYHAFTTLDEAVEFMRGRIA